MRVKIVLWTYHTDANGEHAIKIRVGGKQSKYYPIGASCKESEWTGSRVKSTHKNAGEINSRILELSTLIERELIKNEFADVQAIINGGSGSTDFYFYFQKYLDYIKDKFSYDYWCAYCSIFRKLKDFKPTMDIRELNHDFLRSYERHLISIGNHPNTIHNNFKRISIVVKDLVRSKKINYADNPFLSYKVERRPTKKNRLTFDEIKRLEKQKGISVDMFMFSFYCFGVRIADILRLRHSNIKGGRLCYTMHKTGKERNIKLSKQALEILKRYPKGKSPFVFGVMETGLNEVEESGKISMLSSRYRKQLKAACKKAKVKEVSFHTSRHSVADLAKEKGTDIHSIKELLGHSKTETTEIYMRELYQEQTDKEVDRLFG